MGKRQSWIDVAKCLGIFFIYLGHFCAGAGRAYEFVFKFHVPLFFFLSGCTENFSREVSMGKYVLNRFRKILVPFYGFSIASILVLGCIGKSGFSEIQYSIIAMLKGAVRNSFVGFQLWFLSCLFVMAICFRVIRVVRNRFLMLLVCLVMYLYAEFLMNPWPKENPHMPYNVDSMMFYIVFYALGYCIYPAISWLYAQNNKIKIIILYALLMLSGAYSVMVFVGKNILMQLCIDKVSIAIVNDLVQPVIIIVFVCLLSKMLENSKSLSKTGSESLFLCGNEYIIKTLIPYVLSLVGFNIILSTPLYVFIYTIVLILICIIIVIPIEKRIIDMLIKALRKTIVT